MLISQGKMQVRQLIENQLLATGSARRGALGEGHPPFAAPVNAAGTDPRGEAPRGIALPLCVTPCSHFQASEARA